VLASVAKSFPSTLNGKSHYESTTALQLVLFMIESMLNGLLMNIDN